MRSLTSASSKRLPFRLRLWLSLFLLTLSGTTSITVVYAYNSYQAVRYADRWVDPDEIVRIRNLFFDDRSPYDCANYVSQCLMAGYLPTYQGLWNTKHCITSCDHLSDFLRDVVNADYGTIYKDTGQDPPSSVGPGDVLIYGNAGNWNDHAVIVTEGTGAEVCCNSHTSERYHKPYASIYGTAWDRVTWFDIPPDAGVGADISPTLPDPLVLSNTSGITETPLYASPCFTYADLRIGNFVASDIPDTTYVGLYLYGDDGYGGWILLDLKHVAIPPFLYYQTGEVLDSWFEMPNSGLCLVWMVVDDLEYWAEESEYNNSFDRTDDYEACIGNPQIYVTDFRARCVGRDVILTWSASPKPDLFGFSLHRLCEGLEPSKIAEIPPTCETGHPCEEREFSYTDRNVEPGTGYIYRLDVELRNGSASPVASASILVPARRGILASSALPNPFREFTSIRFEIEVPGEVCVSIFDVTGRVVRTFPGEWKVRGGHSLVWDGRGDVGRILAPGLYLCRICVRGHCRMEKTILLR